MHIRNSSTDPKKNWLTKALLAKHYEVSLRTITKWMSVGLLVYLKVGRVVRFDLAACDASLKQYSIVS